MAKRRKQITPNVRMLVLHEAGFRCANPTCRFVLTLDLHHMEYVSEGGPDTADNLLALCRNCHGLHHSGEIPHSSIRAWKFLLLALNEAYDRRSVDILLVLAAMDSIEEVSGDGLPTYASLIAGGLARTVHRHRKNLDDHATSYYNIFLTDKGRAFVDGWKAGDQAAALSLKQARST